MTPSAPYQITKEDVERSMILDNKDIGKWAIKFCGCTHLFLHERNARAWHKALLSKSQKSS